MRTNYHTHSQFCDGKSTAAEMADAAGAAGYAVLGFSSHAPLPFETGWTMKAENLPAYVAEIRRLKAAWSGRMEIVLGLEIDWIEGVVGPGDGRFDSAGLDYRIGAVHFVEPGPDGAFTIDSPPEEFERNFREKAGGDGRLVYRSYYENLAKAVEDGGFDILAHLDLVVRNNAGGRWFDEGSDDYRDAAFSALDPVAESGAVVEINLGPILRGKAQSPHPSLPILKRLRELGVPITVSADAHHVSHLGAGLEIAREHAKAAGYREVAVFSKGNWTLSGVDEL